jgi:membrane protein implicated in regulation of membrane protease activity
MSLLGVDADTDADVDFDVDHDTGHDFSLDKDFSAFSVRSIIAFLTFFGWTGVYLLSQGSSVMWAILVATMSGAAAMFVVAYMIFKFAQLEKSTTVNVYNALDRTGEVYLSIPQHLEGKGKIHIVVDGSLHEFDATTNGLQLPTGSHVRVVDVLEGQVLLVEPELELLDQPKS